MSTPQELFDRARASYQDAVARVREMDELLQNALVRKNLAHRYDTQIVLAQFDMILQAVLLHIAVSDGRFDAMERQFVEQITEYGDLLSLIRSETDGALDLTWSDVASLSPGLQTELVDQLPKLLDELCERFVTLQALADRAVAQVDQLSALTNDISVICACLSMMDGQVTQEELKAFGDAVTQLLTDRWKKFLRA